MGVICLKCQPSKALVAVPVDSTPTTPLVAQRTTPRSRTIADTYTDRVLVPRVTGYWSHSLLCSNKTYLRPPYDWWPNSSVFVVDLSDPTTSINDYRGFAAAENAEVKWELNEMGIPTLTASIVIKDRDIDLRDSDRFPFNQILLDFGLPTIHRADHGRLRGKF